MKQQFFLILSCLFLTISQRVMSQVPDFRIRFFATDALGRKDTVELGFNQNFTNGQDEQLGELNLFDQPADTLDMRIIQRNQANWNCLSNGNGDPIYFEDNFDSKLNLRKDLSFSPGPGVDFFFGNFEIRVFAMDFPVTIDADLSQLPDYFNGWSTLEKLNSTCMVMTQVPLDFFSGTQPLALIDADSATLKVYLQHEVSVKDQYANSRFKLVPNPVASDFELQGLEADGLVDYEILNGLSKTVLKGTSTGKFTVESLSPGLYFLKFGQNGYSSHLSFIKE